VLLVAMVAAWVRFGDEAKVWWAKVLDDSKQAQRARSGSTT
jgi:hypothetical protein